MRNLFDLGIIYNSVEEATNKLPVKLDWNN
jgi:hypothetical protein